VGEGSFSSVADDLIDEGNPNNPIDSTPTANQSTPAATAPQAAAKLGANFSSGYRVLTRAEIQKSLELIFSTSFNEITTEKLIPDLSEEIFDNTQFNSGFSQTHFIGLGRVADLVEQKLTANNSKILLDNFPCLSQGGEACRHEVINFFVPLFLRRPITDEQFATYDSFVGNFERKMNNKILDRVPMFLAALTQSTSFIIRREVGTENGNAFALSPYEVASRLSFFITGAGPDIELLNAAKNNQLSTEEERLTQANRLLNSDRGKAHVVDINKELFRIDDVNAPDAIRDSLIRESELLIEDIVFNKKLAWKNLFSADGTFVNRALASHYKMTAPGGNNFVYTKYPDNDRSGILSHGAFLSHGYAGEPENTSPIRRGLQIVEDLLCRHLPLPSAIDIDNDPAGDHPNECNIQARKLKKIDHNVPLLSQVY